MLPAFTVMMRKDFSIMSGRKKWAYVGFTFSFYISLRKSFFYREFPFLPELKNNWAFSKVCRNAD